MYNGVGVPRLNEGNWRPRNFVFPLLQLVISPYYCHSTTAAGATLLFCVFSSCACWCSWPPFQWLFHSNEAVEGKIDRICSDQASRCYYYNQGADNDLL